MGNDKNKTSSITSWIWIAVMVGIILGTGIFAFFMVSDKGQPDWDYRAVKDLPAESPYGEYELLPAPQHIRGKGGE